MNKLSNDTIQASQMNQQSIKILSPKEAAKYLGISEPLMYELCRRKDFPAIRLTKRRIIIPVASLDAWLANQVNERTNEK